MTDYVKILRKREAGEELFGAEVIYAREADENIVKFNDDATFEDGIMRWKSNGRVPPAEYVALAYYAGFDVNVEASTAERDRETSDFLSAYRERMKDYVPSSEERYEMRAAFGEGATVVNVITGQKFRT